MVGLSSRLVCRGQYLFVYYPVLSAMNSYGWNISQFCLLRAILIGLSPVLVCHGQYWVVYLTDVSCLYNIGW